MTATVPTLGLTTMVHIHWKDRLNYEMTCWCQANCEKLPGMLNRFGLYYLQFEDAEDATAFKLRFGL